MRLPILMMTILLLLNLAVDYYIYSILRSRCRTKAPARFQLISAVVLYLLVIVGICLPRRSGGDEVLLSVMWILFSYFTVYIPKYIFVIFDLISRVPQLFKCRPIKVLSFMGGILSVVIFLAMWWGALINRYRIDIREVSVEIPGLPQSFDGYKMVQFSDIHVGTYGRNDKFVSHMVDKINSMNADVILFTGDIVNRRSEELEPFVDALSRLDAPDGVYSILGNHDYGDYSSWPSESDKKANMELMYELQRAMGWRLLLNESDFVHHGSDSIAIVGVENVGDPPFTVYGSLSDAYPSIGDDVVKILLTHNPAHWTNDIADDENKNIALTLSGHTHAMQMEVMGLSPAVWRYPTWGGLYADEQGKHKLYVNIGVGTVGIPMRLGATPEITVITLKRPER